MSENTIKYFMWGYQRHTLISLQSLADRIFDKLKSNLKPEVFLLGILTEERDDRYPICLEPEDCGYDISDFNDISKLAIELEKVDEAQFLHHSHPIAQENHNKRLKSKSYMDAIMKILQKRNFIDEGVFHVTSPVSIDGFNVFAILKLNKNEFEKMYSLRKDEIDGRIHKDKSFQNSLLDVYLKESYKILSNPNTSFAERNRETYEIFREAGKNFMYTIATAGDNYYGIHGLYDACNEIAAMKYEGAVSIGNIIIAPQNHENIKYIIKLEKPINIKNHRKVRKFLEISDDKSSIISDATLIYGIGELKGKYNSLQENLFVIKFTSHFCWEVFHDNNSMMVVEYREPSLNIEKINREKFYSDLKRIFIDITDNDLLNLWHITIEATKQKHGTVLVICGNAEEEAERLKNQSFKIYPTFLDDSLVNQLTSIDGAVLINKNGICYAIGVILDGMASSKGDSSRGARYNSSIRYYESNKDKMPISIVIVSEDGMIDLVPNLKPQIKHSEIINKINYFKALLDKDDFERKNFNFTMDYFNKNKFYLSIDECNEINQYRKKIEDKFNEKLLNMKILYDDLTPNEEMNESYFND